MRSISFRIAKVACWKRHFMNLFHGTNPRLTHSSFEFTYTKWSSRKSISIEFLSNGEFNLYSLRDVGCFIANACETFKSLQYFHGATYLGSEFPRCDFPKQWLSGLAVSGFFDFRIRRAIEDICAHYQLGIQSHSNTVSWLVDITKRFCWFWRPNENR